MVASLMRWLTPAALCAVAAWLPLRRHPHPPRKTDPLDPGASVPTVAYESAFSRYRRTADDKAIPWREANDTAARIGGWRTYAREAQQPDPARRRPPHARPTRHRRPCPCRKGMAATRCHEDRSCSSHHPSGAHRCSGHACSSCCCSLAAAVLAGCASFSPDGGFSTVEQAARERLGKEVRWARAARRPGRHRPARRQSCWPSRCRPTMRSRSRC
jgi:hypothetical protein